MLVVTNNMQCPCINRFYTISSGSVSVCLCVLTGSLQRLELGRAERGELGLGKVSLSERVWIVPRAQLALFLAS